jgi:hypothetical protein
MSPDRWDLLYLDRSASSSDVGVSNQGQGNFAVLPFFAVPAGGERPALLKTTRVWERFPDAYLKLLLGIDFCISHDIDALNLSVGPDTNEPFDPNSPFQIATRTAYERGIPVIVAAGNRGPAQGTLRPLAQAPWVIAVGATDTDGRLLESSSRGTPGGACPTVVSDGTPGPLAAPAERQWPEWKAGTSFAAPMVGHVVLWVQVCLRLILGNLSDQQADRWSAFSHPLRFPIAGVVDTGVSPRHLPPFSPLAAYYLNQGQVSVRIGRGEQERQWYAQVVEALRRAGVACQVSAEPDVVKRAIELLARPLAGYQPYEVGAGFVSDEEALAFFSALTPRRWLQLFCPHALDRLSPQTLGQLDSDLGPLWPAHAVQATRELFGGGVRFVVAKVY